MLSKSYTESTAINQSQLKDFEKLSLQEFYKKWVLKEKQEDESKFLFGSLVDQLAFEPESLDKEFIVATCEMPSDTIRKIVMKVFQQVQSEEGDNKPLDAYKQLITYFATEANYGNGWKSDTVIDKIVKSASAFFDFLMKTKGKKIISQTDYHDAWGVVQTLKGSPISNSYFDKEQLGIELNYQVEIFMDYRFGDLEVIPLKGCIDILRWNHIDKTVQIIDLKTTRSVKEFTQSIKDYGYGYQMSYYTELLKSLLEVTGRADYKILHPYNLVIERYSKAPHIFVYNDRDLASLKSGDYIRGIKGWVDTLYEIYWHTHNNEWYFLREMKTKGKIEVII